MQDYALTKHRIFQWIGIILALSLIGVGYWYYRSQASTLNKSPTDSITGGLVSYWTFDGTSVSSTTATDVGSGGNNGTLQNGPETVEGVNGQALNFFPNSGDNNSRMYIADPVDGDLDFGSGDFSVGFWLKTKGYTAQGSSANVILTKKTTDSGNSAGYSFQINTTSIISFTVGNGSSFSSIPLPAGTSDNIWHHYVGLRSGDTLYFYRDGALIGTNSITGSTSSSNRFIIGSDDVGTTGNDRNINGAMDEVRIYNRALNTNEIQSLYALGQADKLNSASVQPQGGNQLDSALALYWALDDGSGTSATDNSTNANHGTLTGGPTWTTGQIGGAVDFDGTDDYITLADTDVLDMLNSQHFTLSGWFSRDTFTTDDTILAKRAGIANTDDGYIIYIDDATDQLIFEASEAGGTDEYQMTSDSTFTASGWHHFTIVWDDSGAGQTRLYIDGNAESPATSGTFANVASLANAVAFTLGAESDIGNPFDGQIDEVRVYQRALSADEVLHLYHLTVPTKVDTGLKGYWSFNASDMGSVTAYDRSGVGNTGTLTNGPTKVMGKVGQGLSFDGSDDYITVADASALDIVGAISMGLWVKTSDTDSCIMSKTIVSSGKCFESVGNKVYEIGILSNTIYFQTSNGVTANELSGSASSITDNKWHHLFVTWDGTTGSNGMKLYVDGALLYQATATVSSIQSSNSTLTFGGDGGEYDYAGLMDEGRLYNRALSAVEIKSLYNLGESDKANSSASQPQGTGRLDSGLAGYWALDDGSGTSATDSSTNGNTGTLTAGPTWTAGQIGGAVNFDGSNDYIDLGDLPALEIGSRFAMSAWVYPTANGYYPAILAKSSVFDEASSKYSFYFSSTSRQLNFTKGGITRNGSAALTVPLNQWSFVAASEDGSNLTLWVNGVSETFSATGTPTYSTETAKIGSFNGSTGGNGVFSGRIDDVRVYNRTLSPDEISQLSRLTAPTGVDTSLKGYWSFNGQDMNGTTAYDRSGAGNNGTLTNGTIKSFGKVGQGIRFDGTDDYVSIGDIADYEMSSSKTISLWFKSDVNPADREFLITKGYNSPTNYEWELSINGYNSDKLRFAIYQNDSLSSYIHTDSETVIDTSGSVWYHVAAVYDSSVPGVYVYVNGVLEGSSTSTTGSIETGDTAAVLLGKREDSAETEFSGTMDEVRIYNRALSAGEITSLYNRSR